MIMGSFRSAILSLVVSLTTAAPVSTANHSLQFSFEQVLVSKPYLHPAADYAYDIAKYGGVIPQNVANAASNQTGSIVNLPVSNNKRYLVPVNIGENFFNLDFDTGSADLWVLTPQTGANDAQYSLYSPNPANKIQGYNFSIAYQDGARATGDVYRDFIAVDGLSYPSQSIQAATNVSPGLLQEPGLDGFLGLGFSSQNTVKPVPQNTFFDNIKDSLTSKIFAVTIKKDAAGSYDFGFVDRKKYQGELVYTAVDNSTGFWFITASSWSVGGVDGSLLVDPAVVDTGATLILLDWFSTEQYYGYVANAVNSDSEGGWIFPCDSKLPDFGLVVNGATITVPGLFINRADLGNGMCFGGIQARPPGQNFNSLGDVFLQSQYVVFDPETPQIGIAPQART